MALPVKRGTSALRIAEGILETYATTIQGVLPGRFKKQLLSLSPRDVLLTAMQIFVHQAVDLHELSLSSPDDRDIRAEADMVWMRAAKLALDAAPYVHVKMNTLSLDNGAGGDQIDDDERRQLISAVEAYLAEEPEPGAAPEGAPRPEGGTGRIREGEATFQSLP